jgi:hypothetical protein
MDAVSDRVNWSSVAARAFENELAQLNARKKGATVDDAIARLRAAEEEDSNEELQRGIICGKGWAITLARPRHLKRLMAFFEEHIALRGSTAVACVEALTGRAEDLGRLLAEIIEPALRDCEDQDVDAFWERNVAGGRATINDEDFAAGFIDGATEIWAEVEKKL